MNKHYKDDKTLQWSTVVANNLMNRQRKATGVNSYEKDIKFNPIVFLESRLGAETVQWLDLCCGEANALIEVAEYFYKEQPGSKIQLSGIDLVEHFNTYNEALDGLLSLQTSNLSDWQPTEKYDLISIVHGLHYIGDKIALIRKTASVLKPAGIFIGNLDLNNLQLEGETDSGHIFKSYFEMQGLMYNPKTKIIRIEGTCILPEKFLYLGADDNAGPNYTGQDAVNSIYKRTP